MPTVPTHSNGSTGAMTTVFQPDDRIAISRARFEDEPQDVIQIEADADEAEEGGHILADRRNPRVSADGERNDREVDGERLAETETSFVCVLKDFFRSTFSDHYQAESYCCGGSELMVVPQCCQGAGPAAEPDGGSSVLDLPHAPAATAQRPRPKALAVATGYRYAEDRDGRPIVIVPGTRRAPIDLTGYAAGASYGGTARPGYYGAVANGGSRSTRLATMT